MKIAALIVLGAASMALGQPAPSTTEPPAVLQGQVDFQFERVGLPVPRYTIEVREDGTGRYQADEASTAPSGSSAAVQYGKHIDRPITLSPATVTKIFKLARSQCLVLKKQVLEALLASAKLQDANLQTFA